MHDSDERIDEFISLMTMHQRRLTGYVISLVPSQADADDVMQETNLALWKEFEQFEPGSNFIAWSHRVAFNRVLAWRKRNQRERLVFSEQFLTAVASELDEQAVDDDRLRYLDECVNELPGHHQELIRHRYFSGHGIDQLSEDLGRTPDAIYRMLSRVRCVLHDCVTRKVNAVSSNLP